jgi:hypothetical protein
MICRTGASESLLAWAFDRWAGHRETNTDQFGGFDKRLAASSTTAFSMSCDTPESSTAID